MYTKRMLDFVTMSFIKVTKLNAKANIFSISHLRSRFRKIIQNDGKSTAIILNHIIVNKTRYICL